MNELVLEEIFQVNQWKHTGLPEKLSRLLGLPVFPN